MIPSSQSSEARWNVPEDEALVPAEVQDDDINSAPDDDCTGCSLSASDADHHEYTSQTILGHGNLENDETALEDLRVYKTLLRLEQEASRVERDAVTKRYRVDAMALSFERKEHERTRAKSKLEIEQALSKAEEGRVLTEQAQRRIDQAKGEARIQVRQAKEEAESQTRQMNFELHPAEARAHGTAKNMLASPGSRWKRPSRRWKTLQGAPSLQMRLDIFASRRSEYPC